MGFRLFLLSILLIISSVLMARSGFLTLAHADMMSETMNMDCTSSSPCFLNHTSEVNLAVPQKSLFYMLLLVVFLGFRVEGVGLRFEAVQRRLRRYRQGMTSLLFLNFCRDFIRHGFLAPKMDVAA